MNRFPIDHALKFGIQDADKISIIRVEFGFGNGWIHVRLRNLRFIKNIMCHENLRVPIFVHACIHQVRLSLQRSDISGRQNETGKTVVPVLRNHVSTTLPQLQIRHLGRIVLSLAFFFSGGFFGGGKSVAMVGETVHAQIPFISRHCDFKQFIFTSPRHFLGKKTHPKFFQPTPLAQEVRLLGCSTTIFVSTVQRATGQQIPLGVCHFLCCFWKWRVMGRQPFWKTMVRPSTLPSTKLYFWILYFIFWLSLLTVYTVYPAIYHIYRTRKGFLDDWRKKCMRLYTSLLPWFLPTSWTIEMPPSQTLAAKKTSELPCL